MADRTDLEKNKFGLQDGFVALDAAGSLPGNGDEFDMTIDDLEAQKFIDGTTKFRTVTSV